MSQEDGTLWLETPLIRSVHLSSLLQCNVYLKLETLQPSQSFKYRGISHYAVSQPTVDFMRREGAEVVVTEGTYYKQALQRAKEMVGANPEARVLVPGYDDPILWEGHASMVHEIKRQLPQDTKPDAIFCSLGRGGLAGGIIEGCKTVGWDDVPLVTVETHGSNCFYQSLCLNEGPFAGDVGSRPITEGTTQQFNAEHNVKVAHLSELLSKATSLGASSPSAAIVRKALDRTGGVRSLCIPDAMAMQAALNFAEDHKTLVELACAVTIAPAYHPNVFRMTRGFRMQPADEPERD
ncbi:tryptophan synthase beta subunit-like PLP-dependent enzyme [Trametes polyzona]|nr:tryptophan synthase beta subunit-like PLP-dependent enzyme [Trametes polyzona]